MTLATESLEAVEKRLPKIISARTHGMIDYCHASFFIGMAIVCRRRNRRAAAAALVTGAFVLVESLLTDYPLGLKPLIPFAAHGRMDAGFAASSLVIPKIFGFDDSPEASVFKANTMIEGIVVGFTDFNSERAREQREEDH